MKRMAWIAAGAALLLAVSGAAAQSLADVARSARKAKAQQTTTSRHFDNDNLPTQTHLSVVGPENANGASEGRNQASDQGKPGQPGPEASNASSTPAEAKAPDQGKPGQPEQEASNASSTPEEAKAPASEAKAPAAENKAGKVDWNKKIQDQKAKIDTLAKDLDLTQREYRLRAVAMYSDAGNRLRNAAQWDKEDAQYKKEIADKQQALDGAKQELNDMEAQARQ
ncbi:MAG: hypothetical protein WCC22_08920 [Terriglobales bacterium]